jgi:hypothetical protein
LNATLLWITLGLTGCLCLLNVALAYIFHKRQKREIFSYIAAGSIELLAFVAVLFLRLGGIHHIPYRFPASVPFTRSEIGAALAIGIGLFPAAYWHRTSPSQLRARMAADAKVMKDREAGVQVRRQIPGEWMN